MKMTTPTLERTRAPRDRKALLETYRSARGQSLHLTKPLNPEDCVVQSMDDVSPMKWHLGHMAWFFEQVILHQFQAEYKPVDPRYYFVYNSYYNSFGDRVDRPLRGTLSRPTVAETIDYRAEVDARIELFISQCPEEIWHEVAELLVLGLNHEQQHQELAVTDIKHILASNPLFPDYRNDLSEIENLPTPDLEFVQFSGGLVEIGARGEDFYYDNEGPRHRVYLNDFKLANRLVTCGEYLEFMEDGGYEDPLLWLSDGWAKLQETGWNSPLYWLKRDDGWYIMTLSGLKKLDRNEPLAHVSYYEAWAFARWSGKRLPLESEWEIACQSQDHNLDTCNFVDRELFHPHQGIDHDASPGKLKQMLGQVWEWTGSAYLPYPGYKMEAGAMGEYNGKFMSDQMVLRGGSCATPQSHIRTTYRNFFQCDKRWQFTGIRLAEDA